MTKLENQQRAIEGLISAEEILRVAAPLRNADRALRRLERLLTKALDHQKVYGGEGSGEAKKMIAQIQGIQDLRDTLDDVWQTKKESKHNPSLLYRE